MPPQAHWSKGTSAFIADVYSSYSKPLHKRAESSDLEPTLLAIPLVIILVIGLASLLIIAHKNRAKSPDPEGVASNGRDEVALQEGKARVETVTAPVAPTPEPDNALKIPVEEHKSYRPPQPDAPKVDTSAVAGASTAQPTRGLVPRPQLPEVDEAAAAEGAGAGEEQCQLHVPEVDGVPVDSIQQALEMDAAQSLPTQAPAPGHHPAVPEADGRAVVGELPGAEEQLTHELNGSKRV